MLNRSCGGRAVFPDASIETACGSKGATMKISRDKNLAFADQPKPISAKDVPTAIKARNPIKVLERVDTQQTLQLPASAKADASAKIEQTPGGAAVRLKISTKLGEHIIPPSVPSKSIPALGNKSANFAKALRSEGFLPDHLGLAPQPAQLPRELQRPPFQLSRGTPSGKRGYQATTIFAPDNRYVFHDTHYPWCTCGRVDSPLGQGSGVMVGPRHLLTVSHVIQWNADGTAGWVKFTPSYFDGSKPFGEAWATLTYFKNKVSGPTIDWIEGMYDYVCIVLDHPIGNLTGWMGAKGYTDGWDGGAYWAHIGYPGDLTGGNRPTYQSGISLDGYWWEFDSHEAMSHQGDVWPGQSGGPFFGWWSGESYPSAVATQSSQNSSENNASGGQDLVDLILKARAEHP
jgi:V8-like Glu-specific endopeptidase